MNDANPNVIAAAVRWIEGLLSGSLASIIAIIAVASVGLLLLAGRLEVRRAIQVIFGCFILFGASSIAAGIMGVLGANGEPAGMNDAPIPPPVQALPAPAPVVVPAGAYDPYAGAAVPPR